MAQIIRGSTALDTQYRCERCGAQAYVEVQLKAGGDLYFCAHHYGEHETTLIQAATKIVDHTNWLKQREGGVPVTQ